MGDGHGGRTAHVIFKLQVCSEEGGEAGEGEYYCCAGEHE